jgi:hypothetical protein
MGFTMSNSESRKDAILSDLRAQRDAAMHEIDSAVVARYARGNVRVQDGLGLDRDALEIMSLAADASMIRIDLALSQAGIAV